MIYFKRLWPFHTSFKSQTAEDKSFDACSEFFSYQRNDEDDIATHLSKIKNLWNILKKEVKIDKGNNVICDNCSLPDIFLMCKVLETLPSEYFAFKSSWMLMNKTERTIDNLTTQLCAHERALKQKHGVSSSETLTAKTDVEHRFKQKLVCNYCGKPNHTIKICRYWISDGKPPKPARYKHFVNREKNLKNNSSNVNEIALLAESAQILFTERDSESWYVDSGATNHITYIKDHFITFQKFSDEHTVKTANGDIVKAIGKGNIKVEATVNNNTHTLTLTDVWLVPDIKKNLFSTLSAQDNQADSKFISYTEKCMFMVEDRLILMGFRKRNGGLYRLNLKHKITEKSMDVTLVDRMNLMQVYHERLAHQNMNHVAKVVKNEFGIELKKDNQLCEACMYGKSHRKKFGTREKTTIQGEIVSCDVVGPFVQSIGGRRYYVCFKDHFTKFRQIYFMKNKSEVVEKLEQFINETKVLGHVIKVILSDNGGEFDCNAVRQLLIKHGIRQRLTMPYTPEQNGCCERDNRTIVEAGRTLMHAHGDLPKGLWAEIINTAAYIINRTGISSIEGKSPYELWIGKKPDINNLRIIGCTCYVHIPKPYHRSKMSKKAIKGILIGYDENDGYRIWITEQSKLMRSRNVVFDENSVISNNSQKTETLPEETESSAIDFRKLQLRDDKKIIEIETPDNTESNPEEVFQEDLDNFENTNSSGEETSNQRQLRDRNSIKPPERYGFETLLMSAETEIENLDEPKRRRKKKGF